MVDYSDAKLDALITIVDYSLKDVLMSIYKNNNVPILLLTHGKGLAKSFVYEILGYGGPKKIVSISIQTKNMAKYLIKQVNDNIDFSKPGTGIAFTINISSISNALSRICIQAEENLKLGSEDMAITSKEPYHLIITIVNSGFFDQVMAAARKVGAIGGTVVHARGLGSKEAQKYLGITIQPEKDLVMILTPKEKKLAIMESIMHEVGLNTAGTGICFSLPVDSAIGVLGQTEDGLDS
ncbi:MAG: P-II family nitrogen regulator [Clostridiaceae bacterium]|nr:P-II family nitrogen regulator [Clostridiaceae bacterium]